MKDELADPRRKAVLNHMKNKGAWITDSEHRNTENIAQTDKGLYSR